MTVGVVVQTPDNSPKDMPHGRMYFNVQVLDQNSTPMQNINVSVVWPANADTTGVYSGGSEYTSKLTTSGSVGTWDTQFGPYVPTTSGTSTVTFTSGSIIKNVEVVVK